MALYKVAFNIWIDQESHPQMTNKQTAIAIAKTLTANEIGGFDWDAEDMGLLFKEYLYFNTQTSEGWEVCEGIETAKTKCQCPDPEFNYCNKVNVKS